jgi:heme-degrading monooxygenase HmoA
VLVRVWEYEVEGDHRAEFERRYGGSGDWARLFATSPGFVGTELFASVGRPGRYVTVDRFIDLEAWRTFLETTGDDYARLDDECSALTADEREIVAVEQ